MMYLLRVGQWYQVSKASISLCCCLASRIILLAPHAVADPVLAHCGQLPRTRQGCGMWDMWDLQRDLRDGQACQAMELWSNSEISPRRVTPLSSGDVSRWSWVTVPAVWKDVGLEWNIATINKSKIYWIRASSISFSLWMWLIHHSSSPGSHPGCKGHNIGCLEAVAMNDKEYSVHHFVQETFLYVSYPNCLCRTAKCITGKESCLFGLLCYLKVAITKWVVSVTVSSCSGSRWCSESCFLGIFIPCLCTHNPLNTASCSDLHSPTAPSVPPSYESHLLSYATVPAGQAADTGSGKAPVTSVEAGWCVLAAGSPYQPNGWLWSYSVLPKPRAVIWVSLLSSLLILIRLGEVAKILFSYFSAKFSWNWPTGLKAFEWRRRVGKERKTDRRITQASSQQAKKKRV